MNQKNNELVVNTPFGPAIGKTKLPQELIDDFNEDCDHIMDHKVKKKTHDHSNSLAGNVKQQLIIGREVFTKWMPYFTKLVESYVKTARDDLRSSPQFKKITFTRAWYVRQFEGDFNPLHYHTGCHMSCVGYLALPKGIDKEWEKEDKGPSRRRSAGSIEMVYGQVQLYSNSALRIRPRVGDYYLFPWWLYHAVYPFRTKGERRSFAFNVSVGSKGGDQ